MSKSKREFCPICDHKYEQNGCACEHVVAAYTVQGIDYPEECGPLGFFDNGILDNSEIHDIYHAAKMYLVSLPPTGCSRHKQLPDRLVVLLQGLVGNLDSGPVEADENPLEFYSDGLATVFAEYLQTIIRDGPTLKKTDTWEEVYGYGSYMTVAHWAEDAVGCADHVRKELISDDDFLQPGPQGSRVASDATMLKLAQCISQRLNNLATDSESTTNQLSGSVEKIKIASAKSLVASGIAKDLDEALKMVDEWY